MLKREHSANLSVKRNWPDKHSVLGALPDAARCH
jgi:hypothetical protein